MEIWLDAIVLKVLQFRSPPVPAGFRTYEKYFSFTYPQCLLVLEH